MPSKVRDNTVVWIQVGRMTRAILNAVCEVSSITVVWIWRIQSFFIPSYVRVHFVHGRDFPQDILPFSSGLHEICVWKIRQEMT
jgi:hypothetical protein